MISKVLIAFGVAVLLHAAPDTRLADAAQQGDRAAVRSLLKLHASVNGAQGDGSTALHWAAYRDDLEMAQLLVQSGADAKAITREGAITPLFMACTNGSASMIDLLLNAGSPLNATKSNGTTPLMTAAASGSAAAVKLLLDRGADINAKEDAHGQTALMFAAALDRAEVVKLLLQRGAAANLTTKSVKLERVRFDQDGNVIPVAAAGGRRGAVAAAPATPAAASETPVPGSGRAGRAGDIAAQIRQVGPSFMGGMTALLYTARDGQMNAARALLDGGADVNKSSDGEGESPLVMAISNGHLEMARYFLDHGADPNLVGIAGLAPLYAAIDVQWAPHAWFPQPSTEQEKVSYLDLMKALLAKGAHVDAKLGKKIWFRSFTHDVTWIDPAGATAFWRAAQSWDAPAMHLLIDAGADPKVVSTAGDTALMAAAGIGWGANFTVNAPYPAFDAVKYCVELGIDVNVADARGYTALHGAAYLGNNEMVNFLVSKGAKVDVKTKAGDTVADMANGPTRFGLPHPETVALLEKLGSANSHNCRSDQCLVAPKEDTAAPRRGAAPAPVPPPAEKPAATTPPKSGGR
ncbi:MAG TPA: ankyrin repeat domain-containing protein [Candidatus Sulfopaludibacter sp.]|jgi:ankyrin repeat protein|nr:ankyrin repeat domain-containing protein [Candidatus Sulfopaludibacter sp.]